jgi:glycosyltransferase involved in cell wall biosynthesis
MTHVTASGQPSGGISAVICAHNAASRLPTTLAHLQQQRATDGLAWEVILVDNASTDDTAAVARQIWQDHGAVPLRIVSEPQLGQAFARLRGLAEARYEFISFIDDDNWVCPDWIRTVADVMSQQPQVGACGGQNDAVYEVAPPQWLVRLGAESLAVGQQSSQGGDVTDTRGLLWGAGLTIRRSAWQDALSQGVTLHVAGRQGAELGSCDDSELCLALRASGWRLWYEPRLTLQHYLPARRLNWTYFRGINRGSGLGTTGLDGYFVALRHKGPWRMIDRVRWSWPWQALSVARRIARHPVKFVASRVGALEGDPDVLRLDQLAGRLAGLLRLRGEYNRRVREVALQLSEGPRTTS